MIPQPGDVVVRRVPFEFPDDLEPVWQPGHHEFSHMWNGVSLTMPYLEPFLISTLREAAEEIDDQRLRDDIAGFCAQEAQHFRTHRRYNELLQRNGYPALAEVEARMERAWKKLRGRSLGYRLAYAGGFENMTQGVTKWLVEDRVELFAGSDTRVASFALWHMVEETEHKRVAFDAYMAARGNQWQRALGVFTGSAHVFWWARKGCIAMLKTDGRWRNLPSRLRLWKRTAEFFASVIPGAIKAALPGHDPRDVPDPEWSREWIAGYVRVDPGYVPLLDTDHDVMPVPFPQAV